MALESPGQAVYRKPGMGELFATPMANREVYLIYAESHVQTCDNLSVWLTWTVCDKKVVGGTI